MNTSTVFFSTYIQRQFRAYNVTGFLIFFDVTKEGKLESRTTMTRLSLGCVILSSIFNITLRRLPQNLFKGPAITSVRTPQRVSANTCMSSFSLSLPLSLPLSLSLSLYHARVLCVHPPTPPSCCLVLSNRERGQERERESEKRVKFCMVVHRLLQKKSVSCSVHLQPQRCRTVI